MSVWPARRLQSSAANSPADSSTTLQITVKPDDSDGSVTGTVYLDESEEAGFVPAFVLGSLHGCKLPQRYVIAYQHISINTYASLALIVVLAS